MKLKYLITTSLILLIYSNCSLASQLNGPTRRDSVWYKKLSVTGEYQYFKTVHHTRFEGGYAFIDYNPGDHFALGIGAGYNYCVLHPDNGYYLRHVKELPVMADLRYVPFANWMVCPFAVVNLGYSTFLKYRQEDPSHVQPTFDKTDRGVYTFGGSGVLVRINHAVTLFTSAGFTGMHMSFNNNDVNPRGLSTQFGMKMMMH